MKLKIKKLHPEAVVPKYQTNGASGFDLHALEDVTLNLWETKLVKTGLSVAVELGYELQVRPRSGNSLKTGLRVTNSPGTVDADYRGEVCVIMQLVPHDNVVQYTIKKGDRVAQGVICPVLQVEFEEVEELDETQRGAGGYGSTGNK